MKRAPHRADERALLQHRVAETPAQDGQVVFHLTKI
jgi:hypothetical protein